MKPLGQGWFAEHGRFWQPVGEAGSRQNPHPHWPVLELQAAFGSVAQDAGHGLLVSKQTGPAVPVHWQHTGGRTQSHLPGPVWRHCEPGGAVAGHGPVHPLAAALKWQRIVVVVVVVVCVIVVDVVVG